MTLSASSIFKGLNNSLRRIKGYGYEGIDIVDLGVFDVDLAYRALTFEQIDKLAFCQSILAAHLDKEPGLFFVSG